jgi:hypothetical protein
MTQDSTVLIALGAFFVVIAVLGAIFYSIIHASRSSEKSEVATHDAGAEVEDEVRKTQLHCFYFVRISKPSLFSWQVVPIVATGRRNAASRMQATRRRRQMAAAAAQQPARNTVAEVEGSEGDSAPEDEDEEEQENKVCSLFNGLKRNVGARSFITGGQSEA